MKQNKKPEPVWLVVADGFPNNSNDWQNGLKLMGCSGCHGSGKHRTDSVAMSTILAGGPKNDALSP